MLQMTMKKSTIKVHKTMKLMQEPLLELNLLQRIKVVIEMVLTKIG